MISDASSTRTGRFSNSKFFLINKKYLVMEHIAKNRLVEILVGFVM